jgi:hypothetical protein
MVATFVKVCCVFLGITITSALFLSVIYGVGRLPFSIFVFLVNCFLGELFISALDAARETKFEKVSAIFS